MKMGDSCEYVARRAQLLACRGAVLSAAVLVAPEDRMLGRWGRGPVVTYEYPAKHAVLVVIAMRRR